MSIALSGRFDCIGCIGAKSAGSSEVARADFISSDIKVGLRREAAHGPRKDPVESRPDATQPLQPSAQEPDKLRFPATRIGSSLGRLKAAKVFRRKPVDLDRLVKALSRVCGLRTDLSSRDPSVP